MKRITKVCVQYDDGTTEQWEGKGTVSDVGTHNEKINPQLPTVHYVSVTLQHDGKR